MHENLQELQGRASMSFIVRIPHWTPYSMCGGMHVKCAVQSVGIVIIAYTAILIPSDI